MADRLLFIPFFAFISVLFIFAYVIGQRRKSVVNESFLLFTFFMMIATFISFITQLPVIKPIVPLLNQIAVPVLLSLGFLFLNFVFTLINKPRNFFYWLSLASFCISAVLLQFMHPLTNMTFEEHNIVQQVPSMWFVPSFILTTLITPAYALWECFKYLKTEKNIVLYRQLRLVIMGALISTPLSVFTLFIGPLIFNSYECLMFAPICILINTIFMFRAVQRHYLLSVNIDQIENAFNRLFENSHDAVVLLDSQGSSIQINSSAKNLFGSQTLLNKDVLERLVPDYDFSKNETDISTSLKFNDETRHIQMSQSLVKSNDLSLGKLLIIRDVSIQKKTEQLILDAKNIESIGQLAGGIAHDFNNFLCGIVSNLTLAKLEVSPDSKAAELITLSENTALNARDLTRQLLTFSKGDSRKIETFDVTAIINETYSFMSHGTITNISCDLPAETILMRSDKGQIRQIFQNLILNAIESMPEGGNIHIIGKTLFLTSDTAPKNIAGMYLQVSIIDHGNGISAENIKKVFEPYFTTKPAGNGLGLAIVNSIITKINGSISVNSQVDKGSVFTLYLPVITQCHQQTAIITETITALPGRILIMDDYPTVRLSLAMLLKRMGYTVDQASSGNQAIELYDKTMQEDGFYQAVITDLTVPGAMGGKDLAMELHKRNPDLPIIVSSGYSDEVAMARYRDFGFIGVLHKPYSQEELQDILGTTLAHA